MEESKFRSGFVAILGRPNVGKSTIMNHIIGMKIAAVSKRAQTTRKRIQTVYTEDRGQIIFLDTPGINRAETKLGEFMLDSAVDTIKTADIVMWVVEPSTFIGAGEKVIAQYIKKAYEADIPVMLVVNKIDTAIAEEQRLDEILNAIDFKVNVIDDKDALITDIVTDGKPGSETLAKVFETYRRYMIEEEGVYFSNIIGVSATTGYNIEKLKTRIFEVLPEGPMYFDEDTVTDETERDIAAEFIREKCLRNLDKEIPHGIAVVVDKMKTREDGSLVDIEATIVCEKESHKGIIIGKKGAMLKRIGTQSRHSSEDMLQMKVNLKLWVKVRPGWRDKTSYMSEYGYKKNK